MASSSLRSVSSLLCAEDNNSVFDENDYGGGSVLSADTWHHPRHQNREELLWQVPQAVSEEYLVLMVDHLPCHDYLHRLTNGDLDFGARNHAIHWIQKKQRVWTVQLLAVACLSLATKINETDPPLCLDLQVGELKFVFEAKTIQRMELLVLSTLRWRMQSITPFSFIDYFLYKVNDDQNPTRDSIMRSIQLILSTVKGIECLEFRPSEIAAAVAIVVVRETKTVHTEKAISLLNHLVEKERVLKCVKLIRGLSSKDGFTNKDTRSGSVSAPLMPQSPIGVLDGVCLSYKSEDTNAAASYANINSSSHNTSPDA
ncbi:cyclin-D2-1, partial [Arachis ipaensis]|uniref:cyclin-D2-1 n=1 Tax=Arachis ipaensis TaxID=130454 RepID=UPI000A2AF944